MNTSCPDYFRFDSNPQAGQRVQKI